jgi:L-threonylcarbamoyladenylate synthase
MKCSIGTDVRHAADILRRGGLVAFATETVYGLGANALDATALARVFEAKNRPRFDPIIAHIADVSRVGQLAADLPEKARELARRFWPGPLTLVLPKRDTVPDLLTAGLPNVGVRVPDHPLALALLRAVEFPVGAPSANPFGQISPTTAEHVVEQLGDKIDYVLDGGACRVGLESTVVHVTDAATVLLRPGGLPVEEIESVVGRVIVPSQAPTIEQTPQLAPGMLARHYAPRTRLVLSTELEKATPHGRIGMLAFRATVVVSLRVEWRQIISAVVFL